VDSDDVQELPDSHNQELTMDELIDMHEQEQGIEEPESSDPVQSEDRMMVGNLTEAFGLIEYDYKFFRKLRFQRRAYFFNKIKE
ncbi:hypothetical protein TNCV_4218681, partial [Trichonephila clavipes]